MNFWKMLINMTLYVSKKHGHVAKTNIMICSMVIYAIVQLQKNTADMEDTQGDIGFCEQIFELYDMCCSKIWNTWYIDAEVWHNRWEQINIVLF